MKNKLQFSVNAEANRVTWGAEGTALCNRPDADFWRLMADDGYYLDMQIKSSQQKGTVTVEGNVTTIRYEKLVTDAGRVLDIALTLTVTSLEDRLVFDSRVENHDEKARADELQYPYFEVTQLCGAREQDVLLRPNGLGERIENPWEVLASAHTEYMGADYQDIKATLSYPRPATMSWLGLQSGENFIYMGRHDARTRLCCLLNALPPRESKETYLATSICQYPFARPAETLELSPVILSMQKGDWRIGSDIYGAFARSTFYHPVKPREWVQNMTGWQRIILRHQYGEIFWKFEDLPRLYLEGKESGLDTLMVFGWWRGRFDNGYPHYEVDEELGGEEGLRRAIQRVQELGGHVILYNNGILIDKKSDFYREHGAEAARIDIDGNEYQDHYKFENNGTVLRNYGYKTFVDACQASTAWRDVMVKNAKLKLSFSPDSIFFDQVGGRCYLCFNPQHRHGYRPDDEMVYRRENLRELRALLGADQALGTEVTNDSVCGEVDYLHGSDFGTSYFCKKRPYYPDRHFVGMFRRTFPEIVMTNRHIHDVRGPYFREGMNHSFISGLRFDVAIYRCRKVGVKDLPEYAAYLGHILSLKEQYHKYFYHGKFVCNTDLDLPACIKYHEYEADGGRLFALWNTDKTQPVAVEISGKRLVLEANSVGCIEIRE